MRHIKTPWPFREHALLLLLFCTCEVFGQAGGGFQPAAYFPPDSTAVVRDLTTQYSALTKALPRKTHERFLEFYKGRHDYVLHQLRNGNLLFSPEITGYFDEIMREILAKNPDIPAGRIRLFISRNPEPNASSLGDGVLLFNIGLLSRLENESQVAFILCHEIGHFVLDHSEEALHKYVETVESEETSKKLEKISKSESGSYQKAAQLLQAIVYDDRRSSREHEREADALGLKYLRNTRYDAREALRCMEILETIDQEKYPDSLDLQACFNSAAYPFKAEWLQEEASSLAFSPDAVEEDETFNADSLRTHPDCPERLRLMAGMLDSYPASGQPKDHQPGQLFQSLAQRADFEAVESYYHAGLSGDCLYHALKLLRQHPGEPYLEGKVGLSLYQLNQALVLHHLDEQVPLPSSKMEPQYRKFVAFLHRLRSRELVKLGYHYLTEKPDLPKGNEDLLCALALTAKAAGKLEEFAQHKAAYLAAFPKGRYIVLLGGD